MNRHAIWSIAFTLLVACTLSVSVPAVTATARPAPPVLLLDRAALVEARALALAGTADLAPAIGALRREAEAVASAAPTTVTDKTAPAPSGDAHDYVSLSIYWWPDPAKADGLPYRQQDGQVNPESSDQRRYDAAKLNRMVGAVENLALAAYLTGERSYSDAAARWLRAWFLDDATRMNPTMRYAQIIPGRTEPRGTGIIDSRQLMRAVDAALLLETGSTAADPGPLRGNQGPAWSERDKTALRAWFGQLADWLLRSAQGRMEGRAANNHGSWYDAQLSDFLLFAGRSKDAKDVLAQVGQRRIATQLAADGRQPLELARTRPFHYSAFNLLALSVVGDLAEVDGGDVWHGSEPAIRAAIDFLLPYGDGATWPYVEVGKLDYVSELAPILVRATRAYPGAGYDGALARLATKLDPLGSLRLKLRALGSLGGTAVTPNPPVAA